MHMCTGMSATQSTAGGSRAGCGPAPEHSMHVTCSSYMYSRAIGMRHTHLLSVICSTPGHSCQESAVPYMYMHTHSHCRTLSANNTVHFIECVHMYGVMITYMYMHAGVISQTVRH